MKLSRLFCLLLASLLILATFSLQAVNVTDLYSITIPVADQSQAKRDPAIAQGLNDVLVKISGNTATANDPALKAATANANDLVQQYNYDQNTDATTTQQFPYILTIKFLPTAVNNLLISANLPLWGQDRPLTIFWVGAETDGSQKLVGASDSSPVLNLIDTNAQRRGIPVIFPVLDLTDLNQVSAKDVFESLVTPIRQASTRYGSNAIAIVHLTQQGSDWKTTWTLVTNSNTLNWSFTGADLGSLVQQGVDSIADALAQQFALNSVAQKQIVTVQINDLKTLQNYVQAYSYLQHLARVKSLRLNGMTKDQATFIVEIAGDVAGLQKVINLDQTLTAVNTPANDQTLVYQWTP
jgi:hypothetical protein